MEWGPHVDSLLDKIRLNCVYLTNRHIKNHLYYKGASSYFEIPTIILSVFAGSFAVGSDPFLDQELISVTNCVISMIITILTSVKLYMKIAESASAEQELAISFKSIALDIFKTLSLPEEKRGIDGMAYLNKVYGKYINLVENSAVLNQMNKRDQLLVIDPRMLRGNDDDSLSSNGTPEPRNPLSVDEETI